MEKDLLHKELTDGIIAAFYRVNNELGAGFVENVYQNALFYELQDSGFNVKSQFEIRVFYRGHLVGKYKADLVVNDLIVLELKACDSLVNEHEIQLLNYLKATEYEVGLLMNFGQNPIVKRRIWTNDRKQNPVKSV